MQIKIIFLLLMMAMELGATVSTKSNVAKLYVATFNRAPDEVGLNYWVDSPLSLEDIAKSFFDQEETRAIYGNDVENKSTFIRAVYLNLFDRSPDEGGFYYWHDALSSGEVAVSTFILATINGATGDDRVILDNKAEVGLVFASKGLSSVDDAYEIMNGIDASDISKERALEKFGLVEYQKPAQTEKKYMSSQDGTIYSDAENSLMWQNALIGHDDLNGALSFCSDLSFGGYDNWRLPTQLESQKFHFYMNAEGVVPTQRFDACTAEITSDGYIRTHQGAVVYGGEAGDSINFSGAANVRCVREDDSSTPSSSHSSLTQDSREVVTRHNAIRDELYNGTNMAWSDEVATSAQAYADILGEKGVMEHDLSNNRYGENLAVASYSLSYTDATNLWYEEKPFYHYDTNSCDAGEMCGHYTQMIWRDSLYIGCGSAIMKQGSYKNGVIVVCRYSPSGNITGRKPY